LQVALNITTQIETWTLSYTWYANYTDRMEKEYRCFSPGIDTKAHLEDLDAKAENFGFHFQGSSCPRRKKLLLRQLDP
jgi:hypothetical protein